MEEDNFNNQSNQEDLKELNITNAWHKNIFDSIIELQKLEKICRDGAVDLITYLQTPQTNISLIQFQSIKQMVTEINILLTNSGEKLTKKLLLKSKLSLWKTKNKIYFGKEKIIKTTSNINHIKLFTLTGEYYQILEDLCNIKEQVIVELTPTLFGVEGKKHNQLNKSKSIIIR